MSNLLLIVFRSAIVYLAIILGIRLFGKKELAQLSIIDLVFILLISNAVQNAMVGADSSLVGGLVAAGTLFITNYILKYTLNRFPRFSKIVQGETILLIYKGEINQKNLAKAQLTMDELKEAVREHGVLSTAEVDLAVLELDGNISVLSEEFKHRTFRKRKGHKIIQKSESN